MATATRTIRLDVDVWAKLDALAVERTLSANKLVAEAVAALLDPPKATAPAMPLAHTPANLPRQAMPHVGTGRPADFGVKVNVDALNLPLASEVDRGPMQRTPKARPLGR